MSWYFVGSKAALVDLQWQYLRPNSSWEKGLAICASRRFTKRHLPKAYGLSPGLSLKRRRIKPWKRIMILDDVRWQCIARHVNELLSLSRLKSIYCTSTSRHLWSIPCAGNVHSPRLIAVCCALIFRVEVKIRVFGLHGTRCSLLALWAWTVNLSLVFAFGSIFPT